VSDIKWEEPPPSATGIRQTSEETAQFMAELRAHPKRWAVYREDAGSGAVSPLRKRWKEFEFTGRAITGSPHKGRRVKLFARFVGPGGGTTESTTAATVGDSAPAKAPAKPDPNGPAVRCPACHELCPVSDAGDAIEKRRALSEHYAASSQCEAIAKRQRR
jgi:hypothetical protein